MIVKAMPVRPPPVMVPNSVLVKPKMRLHSANTSPRTANPIPAAMRVRKLAQKILPFDCITKVSNEFDDFPRRRGRLKPIQARMFNDCFVRDCNRSPVAFAIVMVRVVTQA